ncbi:MAG: GNAT family N-acetyltransferase [Mesorhizobium sp.]|nr:MAG: GNAT family N-acetyltransferase [Mesorhizobium sp.]
MQIDMVDKFEALEPLRENWDRIYDSDQEANFFLSWPWMSNWLRRPNWVILAARSPGSNEYVAFFPLQLVTGLDEQAGFYSSIRMAGSYFATYTGFICVPEFEEQVISSFAGRLQALNWTTLHCDDISISARRRQMLLGSFSDNDFVKEKIERRRHTTRTGENINHDIYMYVDLPADWDEFLDGNLGSKTRRDVRHFLRQVENSGEYRIGLADFETIQSDLEVFYQLWLAQWEAKSRVYAQGVIANCRHMLLECHKAGVLFAPVLWKGDTPLGVHITFIDRSKGSLVCFLVSRNVAIRKPPPGLVLHAYSIRWAIQNGLRTYDLGTGDFSYKYSFGSKERLVEGVRIDSTNSRGNRLDQRSLPSVVSSVRKLRQEGKFHLAERGCRQVLETEPSNLEARRLLDEVVAARRIEEQFARALQCHRSKQFLDAQRIYLQVLAANPRHYDANYLLGVLCLQAGRYQAADTYLARATEINPKAAAAYNNRGHALRGLKRYDEALACYEKAIGVKPDFVQAMNNRGVTLRALGRIDEALASFDEVLTLKPDFAKALSNRNQLRVPLPRDRLSIADDVDTLE